MPKRACVCPGCPACRTASGRHGQLFDAATRSLKCPACKAVVTQKRSVRPNSAARGYDGEYQRNKPIVITQGRNGRPCFICGQPFTAGQDITVEHITPLRKGGSSKLENLAPACSGCNTGWNRKR